jgi:D-sedoheptulose 7-phosphate isomerase
MNFPERYKADIVSAVESIDLDKVIEIIELFKHARAQGRNIFVCGLSRSASTASRVLCDLVTRSSFEQLARFRIFGLDGQMAESEVGQDGVSTERRFVEQLKNFAEPDDVVVGISACDNSIPVRRALEYASRAGCKTVAFTGLDGSKLAAHANITIHVDSTHLGTVEDTHVILCHMIGSYFLEFDRC